MLSQRVLQLRGDVGQDAKVVVAVPEEQGVPEALRLHAQQREQVAFAYRIQQVVHIPTCEWCVFVCPHAVYQKVPSFSCGSLYVVLGADSDN